MNHGAYEKCNRCFVGLLKREQVSTRLVRSLCTGVVTVVLVASLSECTLMDQKGAVFEATVRRSIREGNLFSDKAAGKVGL